MNQEELFEKRIQELADAAYYRGIVTFTEFLNLDELHKVNSQKLQTPGVRKESWGGYESAERQMVAFLPDALSFDWSYPMACLSIRAKSAKFAEALIHRDYLGSLLGLGIERNVLGDLLVQERGAHLFCHERMVPFLLEQLRLVRRTPVTAEVVTDPKELPAPKLEPVEGTVASIRLDALLSLAFGDSRSSIAKTIPQGLVFVNGKRITSNGYEPKAGDIISLRKRGRFRYEGEHGRSKKGRSRVTLSRYV